MDRAQFMEQLEKLLTDISEAERQEALHYYESYFEDAGVENEAEVIRELGSPGKVAAIIKADLEESNDSYAEYTEKGYEDTRTREKSQAPDRYRRKAAGGEEDEGSRTAGSRAGRGYQPRSRRSNGAIICIIILLIFLAPFLKGAFGGVVGIVVLIALFPFVLVVILGITALLLFIAAVACVVAGIGLCAAYPAAGVLTAGIGCLIMTLAILFAIVLALAAGKFLPWALQKFTDFCNRLLNRGRKEKRGGADV